MRITLYTNDLNQINQKQNIPITRYSRLYNSQMRCTVYKFLLQKILFLDKVHTNKGVLNHIHVVVK